MSRPAEDRAIVDAGLKALAFDSGPPLVCDEPAATYERASDEHGRLAVSAATNRLALGDKIRLIPGHCDPTVNLYDWYVCIRAGRVEHPSGRLPRGGRCIDAHQVPKPLKMLRLAFLAMLVLLAAPAVGEGQQSKTIPRLCFLVFERYTLGKRPGLDAFLQTLRDLGYVDGRSIIIDYLSAEERNERFPTIAAECLRLKADVIATTTTPAALAAKNATRTIPIVMIAPGDPVGTGS
jgi:hypothetical protein